MGFPTVFYQDPDLVLFCYFFNLLLILPLESSWSRLGLVFRGLVLPADPGSGHSYASHAWNHLPRVVSGGSTFRDRARIPQDPHLQDAKVQFPFKLA